LDAMYSDDSFDLELNKTNQSLEDKLGKFEQSIIIQALNKNKWNVTKTAVDLGVTRHSLNYRMKRFDISRN
ncbi:MAG: helix-turn-helix domain-containing protein, partial [Tissierellia bacterium]|nr:helix-turn-helix domain-containing protein [Tissierellia bacterium]